MGNRSTDSISGRKTSSSRPPQPTPPLSHSWSLATRLILHVLSLARQPKNGAHLKAMSTLRPTLSLERELMPLLQRRPNSPWPRLPKMTMQAYPHLLVELQEPLPSHLRQKQRLLKKRRRRKRSANAEKEDRYLRERKRVILVKKVLKLDRH